jgi:hypothetical protein
MGSFVILFSAGRSRKRVLGCQIGCDHLKGRDLV